VDRAARAAVESAPEILGGALVLRGRRVPVYHVAASVETGIPLNRILAASYAQARPAADRARIGEVLPKGTVIVRAPP